MKYFIGTFAVCMCVCLVNGQFFGGPQFQNYDGPSSYGLQSLTPEYDIPSAYSGAGNSFSSQRDARQDRGPVVFPPSPPDAPEESSGVIVGASGYGFVPPGQPQYRNHFSLDSSTQRFNRFNSQHYQQLTYY